MRIICEMCGKEISKEEIEKWEKIDSINGLTMCLECWIKTKTGLAKKIVELLNKNKIKEAEQLFDQYCSIPYNERIDFGEERMVKK